MRRWVVPAVFLFCVVILSAAQAAAPATPLQGITEGWVTYANAMKHAELGVECEMLEKAGAVSPEVSRAMATGALKQTGARAIA